MRLTKSRRGKLVILVFILFVLVIVATQSGWLRKGGPLAASQPGFYNVAYFIDGDTIVIDMNGHQETVRFIGVDTPETHKPNTPVQCYGPQAAAYTKKLIGAQRVRLQADPLDTNRDRYGRLLRYIYLSDGSLVDEILIQKGYGFAYLGFPLERADQFALDQKIAKSAKLGLWGSCSPSVNQYGGYTSNAL